MLILASGSPRRKELLAKLDYTFSVQSADIDETAHKGEKPFDYCKRMAREKAQKIATENPNAYVLGADTPVIAGRRILQNPVDIEDARRMLQLQSSRRVYIPTAICLITPEGKALEDMSKSWIKFKPFMPADIKKHVADDTNWCGISGGFKIQDSTIEQLITCTHGSVSGIVGLPLYETRKLLLRAGLAADV